MVTQNPSKKGFRKRFPPLGPVVLYLSEALRSQVAPQIQTTTETEA